MTKLPTIAGLVRLTAALAVGVAFIASADMANAKEHHDNDKYSEHKLHKDKNKNKNKVTTKKTCLYITSDGKRCGGTATKSGGTTTSGGSSGTPGKSSSNPNAVTVSNGVNKFDIPNSPHGLFISSEKPGTITVSNGFESQTFNGGSVTLHGVGIASGAINTQTLPGLQAVKLTNGDISIALNPQ